MKDYFINLFEMEDEYITKENIQYLAVFILNMVFVLAALYFMWSL